MLLSMALVAWIRLLPQTLPGIDDPALRAELSYTGADGREHVYLGDFDSYLWLRYARNLLQSGTPCDAVTNGECRDTHTNAPVGARTPYARSLHVAAIAGLHRVLTSVTPSYPLPATAFLVPVIAGVLGVIPAFFIARALAGNAAGLFAGILVGVHPIVLTRTTGSDNDVWQVVLPLFLLWAAMAGLAAATSARAVIFAGLAGLVLGLQAWAWRGWPFIYIVLIAGFAAAALADGLRYGIRRRTMRIWHAPGVGRIALVLMVFYVVAAAGVTLAHSEEPYFSVPLKAAGAVLNAVMGAQPGNDTASDWPNALSRVAELAPLRLAGVANANGGTAAFFASLVGVLLLLLPNAGWRWWHRAAFAAAATVSAVTLIALDPGRTTALALLLVPLVMLLVAQAWGDDEPVLAQRGTALVVCAWYLAAVVVAYQGRRLLLLLAPPFGIACAILFGRAEGWLRRQIAAMPGAYRVIGVGVLTGVLALAVLTPLRWGFDAARRYVPLVHDAWWDALTDLRETTPRDAIVHTWWDYGHWVTYIAERRVINDGSSLLTHIPNWVSRALMAPDEASSAGILRMLSCGSDATPLPEGAAGAYGKLRALGRDAADADATLSGVVTLGARAADAFLAGRQFTAAEREDILRSTHCDAPASYLVLNSGLVSKRRTWMAFGQWQPRPEARTAPGAPAPAVGGIGLLGDDTPGALADGPEAPPDAAADATLPAVPFVPYWIPCETARPDGDRECEVGLAPGGVAPIFETFTYRAASPENGRLHSRAGSNGPLADANTAGTPAAILVADAVGIREIAFPSPSYPHLGVLIDVPGERILVGALPFLKSTFVQLMYLDGRYSRLFVKQGTRETSGERIVTWKITWALY